MRDTAHAQPGPAGQPLFAATATRLLMATALAVFSSNALTDPTIEGRHDAHPATLRRAIAFILENAHTNITPPTSAPPASSLSAPSSSPSGGTWTPPRPTTCAASGSTALP